MSENSPWADYSYKRGREFTEGGKVISVDPDRAIMAGDIVIVDSSKDYRVVHVSEDSVIGYPLEMGVPDRDGDLTVLSWDSFEQRQKRDVNEVIEGIAERAGDDIEFKGLE